MTDAERQYRHHLLMLIAVGAALRLSGLGWDGGRLFQPDEGNLVRAALGLGPGGRFIPEFHAYNDLALWLPRLLSLPFCAPGDAPCLSGVSRLVSALFSTAAIAPAAALARLLAGRTAPRQAGLAAAAFVAFLAPLVQWAHFGTTESALILVLLLLWLVAARWLDGDLGTRAMALRSGALVGIGFGFKTSALVMALIPLTALLLAGRPFRRHLRSAAIGAALAVLLALAAAPSLVLAPEGWLATMRFEHDVVSGALPVFWTRQFESARNGWYELGQLSSALAGVGLLLAGAGMALVPRDRRRLALPALVFALAYAAIVFGWQAKFIRYLAPFIPLAAVFAGLAVGRLSRGEFGQTARVLALSSLGLIALSGLDQAAIYLREDPRLAAERLLLKRARADEIIAIEPRDMAQAGGLATIELPLMQEHLTPDRLAAPLAQASWLVLASRRNWSVLPQGSTASSPLLCRYYAALASGELGYVPVARFDRAGPFGHLFAPSLAAEETRRVFDRPEVIVLWKRAALAPAAMAALLAEPSDPATCTKPALQAAWRRPW